MNTTVLPASGWTYRHRMHGTFVRVVQYDKTVIVQRRSGECAAMYQSKFWREYVHAALYDPQRN